MKNILAGLDARQRLLAVTSAIVLSVVIIILIWVSLLKDIARLETSVAQQRKLEQWMQQSAKEALQLRGVTVGNGGNSANKSLLAIVDETARQSQLGQAMKRVEPEGQDKVRIQLEGAAFDDIEQWLEKLATNYNIRVDKIAIDKIDQTGFVNARVTLAGAAE